VRAFVALEIALLTAFGLLAMAVQGPPTRFDMQLLGAVHEWDAVWFHSAFAWITNLGDAKVLVPAVTLTAALLVARKMPRAAIVCVLVGLTVFVLDNALKAVFVRDRPFQGLVHLRSWSFPSGHTLSATAVWGIVCAALSGGRRWPWVLHGVLALSIAMSRLSLGVHWPTDVLGGFVLGWALLGAGVVALRRWRD
jgi:membrane-associated phospholipid phosphatase